MTLYFSSMIFCIARLMLTQVSVIGLNTDTPDYFLQLVVCPHSVRAFFCLRTIAVNSLTACELLVEEGATTSVIALSNYF